MGLKQFTTRGAGYYSVCIWIDLFVHVEPLTHLILQLDHLILQLDHLILQLRTPSPT
jgi:hypothetical protein